jgi:hypothetical protein
MNAPWLFAEAYKYRRLRECFSVSRYWSDYDVFYRQKVRNSRSSIDRISYPHLVRYLLPVHRSCFRALPAFRGAIFHCRIKIGRGEA